MNDVSTLQVDFVEKAITQVEIIDKELITVTLYTLDITSKSIASLNDVNLNNLKNNDVLTYKLSTQKWINKELSDIIVESGFIYNEVPTQITSKKFQTINIYKTGTLRVFFNGIKEKNITEISSTEFELPIDFVVGDDVEINYIKD